MYEQLLTENLFDLDQTIASKIFEKVNYPWEVLGNLDEFIMEIGNSLDPKDYVKKRDNIWIAKTAKIAKTAGIRGPVIIGKYAEIRHCAFIRGNVIIGEEAVVGNSTELKNCVLFNKVQVPHYNYIGDSIIGYKAHFGAGSITSNIKSDRSPIEVRLNGERVPTGRIKVGAMIGDHVEIGCNSVLNPGTVIGRETNVYPLSMVRGYIPAKSIYKKKGEVVFKK